MSRYVSGEVFNLSEMNEPLPRSFISEDINDYVSICSLAEGCDTGAGSLQFPHMLLVHQGTVECYIKKNGVEESWPVSAGMFTVFPSHVLVGMRAESDAVGTKILLIHATVAKEIEEKKAYYIRELVAYPDEGVNWKYLLSNGSSNLTIVAFADGYESKIDNLQDEIVLTCVEGKMSLRYKDEEYTIHQGENFIVEPDHTLVIRATFGKMKFSAAYRFIG